MSGESRFQTTSPTGLNHELLPMRLWAKAKKLGIWDPQNIELDQDHDDWQHMDELEQEVILHLTSQFLAGEESVTLDLLPLIKTVAEQGRLEEEMYLTSFLFEEAKHVEVFRRFLDEVADEHTDLSRFHGDNHTQIFEQSLPQALNRLYEDSSPVALAEASVTYNMIVEGVLAETGYRAFHHMLEANELMPGMCRVAGLLKQDESRHLAYGVYLLSRLVAEHGDPVWEAIEARMTALLPVALGVVEDTFEPYDELPFGLEKAMFVDYATTQFQKRYARVSKARKQSLAEVTGVAQ